MSTTEADSPIEQYLDELMVAMSGAPPRQVRHLLSEVEAHLRDAASESVTAGASPHEAERQAVAQFGAAPLVAEHERGRLRPSWSSLVRQVIGSTVWLGGIGAVAVGLSGALAGLLALVGGSRFVVDLTPGQQLSPIDCARWLGQDISTTDCHTAAVADWIGEVVGYRLALGLLGALVLLARQLIIRAGRRRGRSPHLLPAAVTDTVAATLFTAAGVLAAGMAVDMAVLDAGRASGQWLSAALVALPAAVVFIARLARQLRQPPARATAAEATYA